MKKSMFLLASLALTTALYAQTDGADAFSREDILSVFSQFNPSVLEKAQQNPQYNDWLEQFLQNYQGSRAASYYDFIAAVRNFDVSIDLQALTNTYYQLWLTAKMTGGNIVPLRQSFQADVTMLFEKVWAVTVMVRRYELQNLQARQKELRKDSSLSESVRRERQEQLAARIRALETELNILQKNPGQYIVSAVDNYVVNVETQFEQAAFATQPKTAKAKAQAARQSSNLQVKTNHKKPVAK